MPLPFRKRSFGSVRVYSVDRGEVARAIETLKRSLQKHPEVLAVVLFGSLARGDFTVRSDVDLLVVLRACSLPYLERLERYAPSSLPLDVDLFVYTVAEILQGQPLARTALQTGKVLWERIPGLVQTLRQGRAPRDLKP